MIGAIPDATGTERKKDPRPLTNPQEGLPEDTSVVSLMKTRQRKIFFVVGQNGKWHWGAKGHTAGEVQVAGVTRTQHTCG